MLARLPAVGPDGVLITSPGYVTGPIYTPIPQNPNVNLIPENNSGTNNTSTNNSGINGQVNNNPIITSGMTEIPSINPSWVLIGLIILGVIFYFDR